MLRQLRPQPFLFLRALGRLAAMQGAGLPLPVAPRHAVSGDHSTGIPRLRQRLPDPTITKLPNGLTANGFTATNRRPLYSSFY